MGNQKAKKEICRRDTQPDFVASENDGGKVIAGHAAVFNQQADICGLFGEEIENGAFDGCDLTDVPLLANHDMRKTPLARSRRNNGNSTMTLSIDDVGLAINATLDTENNPESRAVYSAISRGDLSGMSFAFTVRDEEWTGLDSKYPIRRIKKIEKVYEVSAVTFPAYEQTDIYARAKSALESAREAVETAKEQAADAARNGLDIIRMRNIIHSKGED